MRVNRLDHVNVQTRRLAESVAFYAGVLGLAEGDPPGNLDATRIRWMFDEDRRPIVHLSMPGTLTDADARAENAATDTGALHHVALDCSGYHDMVARLEGMGVPYTALHAEAIDLRQLFVRDPNGVLIELNYAKGQH